jgi:DNA-3-methyladenine glycosylase II
MSAARSRGGGALAAAATELGERCAVMRRLVLRHGPPDLAWGRQKTAFASLARSICFQQLAGAAASKIYGRLEDLMGGDPTPREILRRREPTLRAVGLSGSKVASLKDLARKVEDGDVAIDDFPRMRDAAIVDQLVTVRGIGEWTAQMHLMFHLGRRDVWPVLDYGVRKGYAVAYGLPEMPKPRELIAAGDRFAPYRSLAAWYCWRVLDAAKDEKTGAAGA